MQDKTHFVTQDGFDKLKVELDELITVKRKEVAARIADAKELGDLSENAEYSDAKDEQGFVETRIAELQQILHNVEIIKHRKNSSTVEVGSTITVKMKGGKEATYRIVGSSEADPSQNRISNESPLGQAFLSKAVGDTVTVTTPGGETKFEILSAE